MQRLKRRSPPHTVINALSQHIREARPAGINPPRPADMAECVAPLRPFVFELRLGLAVTILLLPIGADRTAAVVPDDRGRTVADRPPPVLQTPAQIDIVTG